MIVYNNIIERLKDAGYNPGRIKEERLLSEPTMTAIRRNKGITTDSIDKICSLLECQPGELMSWYDDDGGYLIDEDCELDFIMEDIENAIKALDRTTQNISNLGVLIGAEKKTPKELQDMCELLADQIKKNSYNLKSAERWAKVLLNRRKKFSVRVK